MSGSALFTPIKVGTMELGHRVAMAPLTRFRANPDHSHSDLAIEYYEQRATYPGTLIITEATFISAKAGGYPNVPGLYEPSHIESWKKIVDAVHGKKSFLVAQLWNLGRVAVAPVLEASGNVVSGPSVTPAEAGGAPVHALTIEEIQSTVQDYATAAKNFISAGGDGVEIHSANGYLLDQFLQKNSNDRNDNYGGSVENRSRFTLEAVAAVVSAVGQNKTGIRLSPFSTFQGMKMDLADIHETFSYLVNQLKSLYPNLAYLHVVESRIMGNVDTPEVEGESIDFLYKIWTPLPFLVAGGFNGAQGLKEAEDRPNSVVVFGRYFISSPDLVQRVKENVALAPYDRDTFYSSGLVGYTDFPRATVEVSA